MQSLLKIGMSPEKYVEDKVWEHVNVPEWLIHPGRGCRFGFHGLYDRTGPGGTKIPRYICYVEKITFSLLPDCYSSRLSGALEEVELAFALVEVTVKLDDSLSEEMLVNNEIPLSSLDLGTAAENLDEGLEL